MEFGVFYQLPCAVDQIPATRIQDTIAQCQLADELGFDAAWIGEHHFSRHGLVSGIFPLLGNIAARTRRIKNSPRTRLKNSPPIRSNSNPQRLPNNLACGIHSVRSTHNQSHCWWFTLIVVERPSNESN